MRKITTYTVALVAIIVLFSSCKKEYETIEELDNKNIQAYKASHSNLTFTDVDGYSYSITDAGTGADIKSSDSVYYSFVFKSTSGNIYNQTNDLTIPGELLGYTDRFYINSNSVTHIFSPVREVLSKLKRGGKATLLLPSRMAFGKNGLSTIGVGSNETIVIELGLYTFEKRHQVDAFEIPTFITRNNLVFTTDPSGIRYNVLAAGTGTEPITQTTTFVCNYTGRYLDGTVFDAGTGFSSRLPELIKGWEIIAGKITAGGKIRIIVPSHLAYGARPLDFDIEVTTVTKD